MDSQSHSQPQIHPDLEGASHHTGGPPYGGPNYSGSHYPGHPSHGGPDDAPSPYLGGPGNFQSHGSLPGGYHSQHHHPGPPSRQHSTSDPHSLQYGSITGHPYPPGSGYGQSASLGPSINNNLPLPPMSDGSISPQSPMNYDGQLPPFQARDNADPLYHSRSGSSASSSSSGSPNTSRAQSLVHRQPLRYNQQTPTTSPPSSTGRRSRGRSSSDDDDGQAQQQPYMDPAQIRKDLTRRQRIEAEQKRRDDLRDWYQRLKEVLPVSNQKNSKTALLERATHLIAAHNKQSQELHHRIAELEGEVVRLRAINERIALQAGGSQPSPGGSYDSLHTGRLTPPPQRQHEQEMRD